MQWFLGVDGGGSRTRMAILDDSGRVAGRSETGLSNLHHASAAEVERNLTLALQQAATAAGGPVTQISGAFLGMAGVTCRATAARFRELARAIGLGHAKVGIDHDIRIALAGGLAGRPGIALIVGTGSSCYGRTADGRHCQSGGWGVLVADEGSGYDLGRRAMVAAVRMADGRLPDGPLRERVFAWLEVKEVSEILQRLYEQGIERNEIAAFAPEVVRLAEAGDAVALGLIVSGANELAAMVEANHRRMPTSNTPEVVITGGLGTAPTLYRERICSAIQTQVPAARLVEAEFEPVVGAALLAMEEAGVPLTAERLATTRRTAR